MINKNNQSDISKDECLKVTIYIPRKLGAEINKIQHNVLETYRIRITPSDFSTAAAIDLIASKFNKYDNKPTKPHKII